MNYSTEKPPFSASDVFETLMNTELFLFCLSPLPGESATHPLARLCDRLLCRAEFFSDTAS